MIRIKDLKDSETGNLLEEELKGLPENHGVYLMRDSAAKIIYVGKAVNLRNRLRSYFGSLEKLAPKTQTLVSRIADFEYYLTKSEQEALILELNLIKRYRPRFNVRLKDDKTYPYLMIDTSEDWPDIRVTRRTDKASCRYFGPFTSAGAMRKTLKVIHRIFPLRSCKKPITGKEKRPCLKYHIQHCAAPCIGAISRGEYANLLNQATLFLEGKEELVARVLQDSMAKAAKALEFEKAARIRDQLRAINEVITEQKMAMTLRDEQDVIAFAQDDDQACVQIFFIRNSKLIGRESFMLRGTRDEEPPEIMGSFILQFYDGAPNIPPRLLLQHPVKEKKLIEEWLSGKGGQKVRIQVPKKGHKKQFIEIVTENARQSLEQQKIRERSSAQLLAAALSELKKELELPGRPARIEGYDISNVQGKDAVGSMVVFENGKPKNAHYRRFRIKTVPGADDYAMLREVLKRRFKRMAPGSEVTESWAVFPDLVLIDGGKGQLNAALQILQELNVNSIPVVSLAKENEEIFRPGKRNPVVLPKSSAGLKMLQRLRDEAHRFATNYYQKVHQKGTFASALEGIPGIGPKRRQALIKHFGSVRAIRDSSVEDLAKVKGINPELAEMVKSHL